MDIYRRVSRKAGREGDGYRSPEIQLEASLGWAKLNSVEVGKIPPPEEDVSGATAVADRELEKLLERVEAGVSGGIITYNSKRFARDTIANLIAAKRIKDAGGRLVGVSDGVDSATQAGEIQLALMATMGEQELNQIKEGWKRATGAAVASGIHIACRAPLGYLRNDQVNPAYDAKGKLIRDGRLVIDPVAGPVVRRAFEMRGEGASLGEIREMMMEGLGRAVAKSTISTLLTNRAYLGEARGGSGGVVNKEAHEPLLKTADGEPDERTWKRAQPKERARSSTPRNGTLSRDTLLGGLVVCDACDHKMQVFGSTNRKTGERIPSYGCHGKHGGDVGDCPAPGATQARGLDDLIIRMIDANHDVLADGAESNAQRLMEARAAVADAESALDAWVDDPSIATTIGAERFTRGLAARQGALDEAKRELWDIDVPEDDDAEPEVGLLDGEPTILTRWHVSTEKDRRLIRRYVAQVRVAKADPARRKYQPLAERVWVRWVGADEAVPATELDSAPWRDKVHGPEERPPVAA
jgi:DNA invertase Pin-like site-specific DNA recombinase